MCVMIFSEDREIESKKDFENLVGDKIYKSPIEDVETCLCDVDIEGLMGKANIRWLKEPFGYQIIEFKGETK